MRNLLLLALIFVLAWPAVAQDEAPSDEDLPAIEYVRSPSGFNVPVLDDTWQRQEDASSVLFTHDAAAQIQVASIETLDDEAAIQTALGDLVDTAAVEPLYTDRIGLGNGTWTQSVYKVDDLTATALALVRRDRTFVITFVEINADYDAYHLAVRNSDVESSDPQEGVGLAVERLLDDEFEAADSAQPLDLPSGAWQQYVYGEDATAYGLVFRGISYTTVITGSTDAADDIADAFNTIFLGFFMTPNNDEFLYLGLASVAFILLGLIGSMWWRYRNARQDLQTLSELED